MYFKENYNYTLAAQENIPLLVARKKISSELLAPERDIRFDFDSFPFLTMRTNSASQRSNMDGNRYASLNSEFTNRFINEDHAYASVATTSLRKLSVPSGKNLLIETAWISVYSYSSSNRA